MLNTAVPSGRDGLLWWLIFCTGVGLSVLFAFRSQLGGDQYLMLDLGWRLVNEGQWSPYGMPTSAGGRSPGGFMALLMALPLYVWADYRSPALLTLALHAAAFLLLAHALRHVLTTRGMWLLLLFVWVNPWRLYFSAHVWNANFMFVAAVLHLVTAQRMAARRGAWTTFLHVVLIALAVQVHTSAVVLAFLSLLLFSRRMIQVHWGGFALGVVIGVAAYIPWLLAVIEDPALTPGAKGFLLRGLILVTPFLRGVLYSLKMGSLSLNTRTLDFDFTPVFGADANAILAPIGVVVGVLGHLTLVPSLWANWRFVRKAWPVWRWRQPQPSRPRTWLRGYIMLLLAAALFSFAISPTTTMFWQAFIVLPAVALVLVMTAEALLRTRARDKVSGYARAWCVLAALLLGFQGLAAPLYRCGGRVTDPAYSWGLGAQQRAACEAPSTARDEAL